jgi:hypothetical protein
LFFGSIEIITLGFRKNIASATAIVHFVQRFCPFFQESYSLFRYGFIHVNVFLSVHCYATVKALVKRAVVLYIFQAEPIGLRKRENALRGVQVVMARRVNGKPAGAVLPVGVAIRNGNAN